MVDLKTWRPQPRTYDTSIQTKPVAGVAKVDGETVPRWNAQIDSLKNVPEKGVNTVHDVLTRGAFKFGNAQAVGSRKLIRTHEEVKKVKKEGGQEIDKKWTYFELGPYEYLTFIEFERLALQIGAGLRNAGLQKDDKLHIYSATCQSWQAMAHGATSQSMPIVTTYDTLGESGLTHAIVQTKPKAIFVDAQTLPSISRPLKQASDMKLVVYSSEREVDSAAVDGLKAEFPHISVMSFEELRKSGEANPIPTTPPTPDDVCCIMYTSGSTGVPKGVVLKHENVVAAIAGADVIDGKYLGDRDRFLAFLPLAHIIEFMFENAVIYWGGTLGYGSPRTISDTSMRNSKGDIREFRPTVLVGVPFIWETIKKGIMSKIAKSNLVVRTMFWSALSMKSTMMWTNEWIPGAGVLDAIVFSKVREATGGNVRICLNGGGPISQDTHRFISMVIAPMVLGYGLTETAGMGALTSPVAWTDQALGPCPGSVEIKLVDTPEFGYYSTNANPQGEILIRGKAVASGYLDNEEETRKAFTPDGWFRTGDIGEFDAMGNLKVIDRKKNLVKTLNGEYIALEKLESIYSASPCISSVCTHASIDRQKPVAIVVPAEAALRELARKTGSSNSDASLEVLIQDKKLKTAVLREVQKTGKDGGLAGFEIVDDLVFAQEDWTPQNGFKTAAQKLQRRVIVDKYKDQL